MIRKLLITSMAVLMMACGGKDAPPAPESALLVFPEENSECTTGTSLNDSQSQVTFRWNASKNTDRYTVTVVNLETNSSQNISTVSTSANISIAKGAPFSWSVTSRNNDSDESATSETWLFYNAGAETTYAPFPVQLVYPESGSTVQKDIANEVVLEWSGADVDNDIETFEVYFSETTPPTTLVGTNAAFNMELAVSVESGTVYYWKVITTDSEGNTSDSGVFDFRVY